MPLKAQYKNGSVEVGDLVIHKSGLVSGSMKKGEQYVYGLYDSFREFFRHHLPRRLKLKYYHFGEFDVDGSRIQIRKTRDWCKVKFGDFELLFQFGYLIFTHKRIKLYENRITSDCKFVNDMFADEINCEAKAVYGGEKLIISTLQDKEVLELDRNGYNFLSDFCLVSGELQRTHIVAEWLKNLAGEMELQETVKDRYVFATGAWEAVFEKDGKLKRLTLKSQGIQLMITDYEILISRVEPRKATVLSSVFEGENLITRIFRENNETLRALIF